MCVCNVHCRHIEASYYFVKTFTGVHLYQIICNCPTPGNPSGHRRATPERRTATSASPNRRSTLTSYPSRSRAKSITRPSTNTPKHPETEVNTTVTMRSKRTMNKNSLTTTSRENRKIARLPKRKVTSTRLIIGSEDDNSFCLVSVSISFSTLLLSS